MTNTVSVTPALARRIELWPAEKLRLYSKNARTHSPDQVAQIAASIAEFGFNAPIGYRADEISARIGALKSERDAIRQANQEASDSAIDVARQESANRTAQMIRDRNRSILDSFKRQAEGVFDALLQKSQSVWPAIGNAFKTAMLTAIKEVVTSRAAAMLMMLFNGQKVSFAGSGGVGGADGGGLGSILGIGAVPIFGGGHFGSGPVGGNPMVLSMLGSGGGGVGGGTGGSGGLGGLWVWAAA